MIFGGLITILIESNIKIQDISYSSYDLWNTSRIQNSGQLIGLYVNASTTQVQTICTNTIISSINTSQLSSFGLFGQVNGKLVIENANTYYETQLGTYSKFGAVGQTISSCVMVEYSNWNIQMIMNENNGVNVSALTGYHAALNWSITSIMLNNTITSGFIVGLLAGHASNTGQIYKLFIY
ncbi:Hypothetical_protein [Hexamita inflata]|uniref:Hypothetical_protein n=1 Tax=Hexamita inflata TaxID=28002 RepID=A0AA86RBT7_9EUKA|nr:Hypothetical protein HINF_LOCUS58721 [Hexamita inflata]